MQLLIFLLESEPKLLAAPMAELRAVLLARLLVGQLSLFLAWLWGEYGAAQQQKLWSALPVPVPAGWEGLARP